MPGQVKKNRKKYDVTYDSGWELPSILNRYIIGLCDVWCVEIVRQLNHFTRDYNPLVPVDGSSSCADISVALWINAYPPIAPPKYL